MNGARTTFMRRGYLLTALAAAVLLAASPGIASAQSIGFTESSGSVAEAASHESGALEGPTRITIRATGVPTVPAQRTAVLDAVVLAANGTVRVAMVDPTTGRPGTAAAFVAAGTPPTIDIPIAAANFNTSNEASLMVVQGGTAGDTDGGTDPNWLNEQIRFTLNAGSGVEVSPAAYTLTVNDGDVAPVAKFDAPSFTLTEGSRRVVKLDIFSGTTGRPSTLGDSGGVLNGETGTVVVRVTNHQMVTIGDESSMCATMASERKAVHLALGGAWGTTPDAAAFGRTARLATDATAGTIAILAGTTGTPPTADITVMACNVSGFRDQSVTLTILPNNLVEPPRMASRGDIAIGSPLTVTVDSDEMAPTLSFSPTDVTIDEGGSTSTRLIADGTNATEVGMVKLMVEGDAMVDLYHEDTMLEEMDGYVMVDLGNSNSARLTAMSTSDPDLMDGDMAYKAWKLMEGSSDAMVGEDYWFRVDVRGSTAVPALPLVGQLLLALFLMAGGSRLYRRRNG